VEFGIYFGYGSLAAVVVLAVFFALKKSDILHSHIETVVYVGKWVSAVACLVMDSLSFQLMVRALLVIQNNCDPLNKFGLFSSFLPDASGPDATPNMQFAVWYPSFVNFRIPFGYPFDDPTNLADLSAFRSLCARIPECAVDSIGTTCVVAHPELAQSGKLAFPVFFVCLVIVIAIRGLVEISRLLLILMSIRSRSIVLGELGSIFIKGSAFAPILYLNQGTRVDFNSMIRNRVDLKPTHQHLVIEFCCSAVLIALPLLAATTYYSVRVAQVGLSPLNMLSIFFTLMNSSSLLVRAFYMWIAPWCQSTTHHRELDGQKQADSNSTVVASASNSSLEEIDVSTFELAQPVSSSVDSNHQPASHENKSVPLPAVIEIFGGHMNQEHSSQTESSSSRSSRSVINGKLLSTSNRS
jgi:hypothetical protein